MCFSLLWHRYTYGKPVQGKIDITFITLLQCEMNDFSNSSEMGKQQSWVGEQIRDRKVPPDENVHLSVFPLFCLIAPLMQRNLFNLVSSYLLDLIRQFIFLWLYYLNTALTAHIWLTVSGDVSSLNVILPLAFQGVCMILRRIRSLIFSVLCLFPPITVVSEH